jgi:nucleoside-diphosphate-sugar epimerase
MQSLLLTGASGFLGNIIKKSLPCNFSVSSLGRSTDNKCIVDLVSEIPQFSTSFHLILHAAGKAHTFPKTPAEKQSFFDVNFKGTQNLLRGLESCPTLPRQFVFISTVAVYGLDEGEDIREDAALKGKTPYAKSKIMAEEAVKSWCEKQGVLYVILRLPLVVGENPPGNLGTIHRAVKEGKYFRIKGNKARKSMVLAGDVARLIPRLEGKQGVFNLTDGVHPYFGEIESALEQSTGKRISLSVPLPVMRGVAMVSSLFHRANLRVPLTNATLNKMLSSLTFNDEKARQELGWQPKPVVPWIMRNLK